MHGDIYKNCPTYKNQVITLRRTEERDALELLGCYSDEKAVPFFNSDNCHGDNFYYNTLERMQQAIKFWQESYSNENFIRWTITSNAENAVIGTIEMFHRHAEDEFNHYGVLRMDIKSNYESQHIIKGILDIVNEFFYEDFQVERILTKAVPAAEERLKALRSKGYRELNKRFMTYDNYYVR